MLFYGPNKKDLTKEQIKASIKGYRYVITHSMPDTNCMDQALDNLKIMREKLAAMESKDE